MEKLIVIRTLAELEKLKTYLADKTLVAFDTETTGIEKESEIIGYSISADVDIGYYVILSYWDVKLQKLVYLDTKDGTKEILELLAAKSLIMHNAVFDCWMVENNFGVKLMPSVHTDTMILAHLLDENRACGLKELGVAIFGEDARKEQTEMKDSVTKNGGKLTKDCYELYKADADLLARYGAKDAILTIKIFFHLVPELFEQGLDAFFYDDESMPQLRGPTYDLNTTGLRVDPDKLLSLKGTLETEIMEGKAFIDREILSHISNKYPGTSKAKTFNVGSGQQLSWLLFVQLSNDFNILTPVGREVCKFLGLRLPYSAAAKREFIREVNENKGRVWRKKDWVNPKTKKALKKDAKIGDVWKYLATGSKTLQLLAPKYQWVKRLLEVKKAEKILSTYVIGIMERMKYNVIRPNFLQHGTTSGRYSCKNPNFQNLPKDDKRVKFCIVARPDEVFVGADYSQLEPRIFASLSKDEKLLNSFRMGDDFYSVIGVELFDVPTCSLKKDDKNSFAKLYPDKRDKSKPIALGATYGKTAHSLAIEMGVSVNEAKEIIDNYFERFPSVKKLML